MMLWRLCQIGVVLILGITYSPWVLSPHATDPWLFGLPRILWAGLLSSVCIILLTALGAWSQRGSDETRDRS